MLAKINIWVDLLAIVLTLVVFGFWVFQLLGNIFTGRLRKKFVEWHWPEGHKIPPLPKILHLTHLFSMIGLGFTGLYIRYPFFNGGRTTMRYIHYVFMYIVVANFLYRLYYAYLIDGKEFTFRLYDIKNAPNVLMYYTFLKSGYPHMDKYNPMQKMTYGLAFPSLMVIQAFTGFSLVWPQILLGWAGGLVGGVAVAAAYARIIHFVVCMLFIMLTGIHAWLAVMENFPGFLDFFFIREAEVPEHGHGHGHESESHAAPQGFVQGAVAPEESH